MDFSITEEQRALRENIVRFAQEVLNPGAAERDREQTFSRELWKSCAKIGIQGLPVPEQYGGSGLDPLTCAMALEALGYGCHDGGLVFSLCAHLLSCVPLRFGLALSPTGPGFASTGPRRSSPTVPSPISSSSSP